jgi:hypothetical protein
MAFINNDNTEVSPSTWKKADAFINIELEGTDGSYPKLGAIGLHMSKPNEAELIAWLSSDPEVNSKKLTERLRINYRSAKPATGFKLD